MLLDDMKSRVCSISFQWFTLFIICRVPLELFGEIQLDVKPLSVDDLLRSHRLTVY